MQVSLELYTPLMGVYNFYLTKGIYFREDDISTKRAVLKTKKYSWLAL